jgi:hypothetical protein
VFLPLNGRWIVGFVLLVACRAIFNGAARGESYSFDCSDWGRDSGDRDGGGD